MTEDYTTLAQIKALVPNTATGTTYDALITRLITNSSRAVDSHLKREPGAFSVAAETTRYFLGSGNTEQWIGELAAVPSYVGVAQGYDVADAAGSGGSYTTYGTGDFLLWPDNVLLKKNPILRLDLDLLNGTQTLWYRYAKAVMITGYHGFATTTNLPDEIVMATEIDVVRTFKRSQQMFQDSSAMKDLAQMKYTKALDPQAKEILSHERFQWLW